MPDKPPEKNAQALATELALAQLFTQMVDRDQQMWQRLSERDSQLQGQMVGLFSQLLQANSVDRVLVKGFHEVTEQLKAQVGPLRSLGREYVALPAPDDALLATLQRALVRPDFTQVDAALAIKDVGLLAIPTDRSTGP